MKNFLFVSILYILLCVSCAPAVVRGYKRTGKELILREQIPVVLDTSGRLQKFNMSIDFMQKHFSGMLLIKETARDTYRMVFTTHFGLSVFDFEYARQNFRVLYCIDPLKKRKIQNLFRNDFTILLQLALKNENPAVIYTEKADLPKEVYKFTAFKPNSYYRKNTLTHVLEQIECGSGFGKTKFVFDNYRNGLPEWIQIKHTKLRLTIVLDKINQ